MDIYLNTPNVIDASVIISVIGVIISVFALIFSGMALYFQFLRKTKKLILNIFHYDLSDFSDSPDMRRDIAQNKISLSNSGNTSILLVQINYETIDKKETSTYATHLFPNNLPILLKPEETFLYDVSSNPDLFLNAIKNAEITDHKSFKFNVYLKFTVVVSDKSANYRILIHNTQYYNPQKVHHHYRGSMSGINILNEKYLSPI